MSSDLEYLIKLIEMIDKEPNDHNKRKLWSLVGVLAKKETGELSEKEAHRVISEMHELNLEQHIRVQAEKFYESLKIPLKNKKYLISDFIEMEHSRRRDDFENFSLAVYQQLENIINYLIDSGDYIDRTKRDINLQVLIVKYGPEKGKRKGGPFYKSIFLPPSIFQNGKWVELTDQEKEAYYSKTTQEFLSQGKQKLSFLEKARIILFYCYFDMEVPNYDGWNQVANLFKQVHNSRNKIHRTVVSSDNIESNTFKNPVSYINYLVFHGFLADVFQQIAVHLNDQNAS